MKLKADKALKKSWFKSWVLCIFCWFIFMYKVDFRWANYDNHFKIITGILQIHDRIISKK